MKRLLLVVGALGALFGVLWLNYTVEGGAAHHREWAREHGLPEPSGAVFALAIACALAGALAVGFALGARARRPNPR
jgi:hypothetical protein